MGIASISLRSQHIAEHRFDDDGKVEIHFEQLATFFYRDFLRSISPFPDGGYGEALSILKIIRHEEISSYSQIVVSLFSLLW